MGYTTTSASRTQAESTVSSVIAAFNNPDGSGFGISSTSLADKELKQFSITPGSSSETAIPLGGSGSGLTITNVYVTDSNYDNLDDLSVGDSGGYVKIVGTNFQSGAKVYFNGSPISNTFVSATQINAVIPESSIGSYSLSVFNGDNSGAIWADNISVSGFPSWSQSSYPNSSTVISVQLLATGDGDLTYELQSGSTLPTGLSLSSSGLLSGTVEEQGIFTFTVIVSDEQNQSTQQEIVLSILASEANFRYNTVLISADGENGTNNNVFLDSSNNALTLIKNGSATQGSFSPFTPAAWSYYFDGSGDYLTLASNSAFNVVSNPASVECWVYFSVAPVTAILNGQNSGAGSTMRMGVWGSTFRYTINDDTLRDTGITPVAGRWYHLCLTITGGVARFFIDGVLRKTDSGLGNVAARNETYYIMSEDGSYVITGYMSNFRFCNGSIPTDYQTSSTTVGETIFSVPTSALTTTSQGATSEHVKILTCQSNRFIDNSDNQWPITIFGDIKTTLNIPLAPSSSYNASTMGGSIYLDGTDDFLSTSSLPAQFDLGTSNFTIECWFYLTAIGSQYTILEARNGADYTWIVYITSTRKIQWYYGVGTNNFTCATSLRAGMWNHLALVRNGSDFRVYLNGVSDGNATSANALNYDATDLLLIGADNGSGNRFFFPGYISDLRINSSALYTTNFSIPESPSTIAPLDIFRLEGTNARIYNATTKSAIETVGNAQLNTSVKKYGSASMYFDGTGDGLLVKSQEAFGTGDFTIEAWFNTTATGGTADFMGQLDSGSTFEPCLVRATGTLYWQTNYGATNLMNAAASGLFDGNWHHIAMVRYNGTSKVYLDGTSIMSAADSTNYTSVGDFGVGAIGATYGDYQGYIDDFRITKDFARYTANFTPPTAAHLTQ